MKVVITGGTGFIGSRLALESRKRGHLVTVLGQVNTAAEQANCDLIESHGISVKLGAVTDSQLVTKALKNCDLVFHLAAAQHEANVPDKHFYDVNVEGTRIVLDACVENGVKRLIHGSTIGVYGAAVEGEISEDSLVRPDNIYGKTKLEGEALALSYSDRLPVSVIRISETYGPGDRRLLKLFKAINKRIFFLIGNGANLHQLIYIDDLIQGMYLAAEKNAAAGELFVLAGSEILTTREMVLTISQALNKPIRRFRAPMWPFTIAAVVFEAVLRPLGIQPPIHRRRLDFFRKSLFFSRAKAQGELGFEPQVGLAEGAARSAAWYKKYNLL